MFFSTNHNHIICHVILFCFGLLRTSFHLRCAVVLLPRERLQTLGSLTTQKRAAFLGRMLCWMVLAKVADMPNCGRDRWPPRSASISFIMEPGITRAQPDNLSLPESLCTQKLPGRPASKALGWAHLSCSCVPPSSTCLAAVKSQPPPILCRIILLWNTIKCCGHVSL